MSASLTFTGGLVDRAHLTRKSPQALTEAWIDPRCRVVISWSDLHLVESSGALLPLAPTDPVLDGAVRVFLGHTEHGPVFAAHLPTPPAAQRDQAPPLAAERGGVWYDLRTVGMLASPTDAGLAAYAQGLFGWHRRHRFCGVCGHPTESDEGGHLRLCTNTACATPHFPRTDPAVIMLVHDDQGRILLGRHASWPPGMMSTLAGFVEPGETLEQAVAREVMEEAGIAVTDVRYVASQPWPLPSSLMLGFTARATSTTITVDADELEHARWVTREEIATFRDSIFVDGDGPALPSPISIARHLIRTWLE